MTGERGENLYWMHFEIEEDGAHMVPAQVLVESVANIQRVVYLLAKFTRKERLGQRASFSRTLREAFALQCRVPEPGSYAIQFEIGIATRSPLAAGEVHDVGRLFRRVTSALGGGNVGELQALVPDPRYLDFLGEAYRKATPPSRSGVTYWIEDHLRRRILDGRKSRAALDDIGVHNRRKRRVCKGRISGMLIGMDFDQRRVSLSRPDGKSVSAYYDEASEGQLIEHRRGWVELAGDVHYDSDGRAISVTHARDLETFDECTIELRNVNLYNVSYYASPPLKFKYEYCPHNELYDLGGEFGISVSASSPSELHYELQEALSMLWIEYGEESPDILSPKARLLRSDLRKRLKAA